jgi:hypothetical protein
MVEGLRSGRPLVKFRRVLPVAALLLVTVATYRYYRIPPRAIGFPAGPPLVVRPGTSPSVVAVAVNLPAGIFALPLEFMFLGNSPKQLRLFDAFRIVEFSVIGIVFWFFMGRFFDDLIAWNSLRSGSRWRLSDCVIAALIAAEATLVLAVFVGEPKFDRDVSFLISGVFWAILGYSALIFRILQFRAYPRTAKHAHRSEGLD